MQNKIEMNPQSERALWLMNNTSDSIFLTGKAGTGKSTLLNNFRKNSKKKYVVLGSTGIAALNVKGQTIHSFFRFGCSPNIDKMPDIYGDQTNIYREVEMIIIDEVSMVSSYLLDCINGFLKIYGPNSDKPFGGIQMVFIGDLYQLPPVITDEDKESFFKNYKSGFFFSAKVFDLFNFHYVELVKVYRQKDDRFVKMLNAIRVNSVDYKTLSLINTRENKRIFRKNGGFVITIATTNSIVKDINNSELKKLNNKVKTYQASYSDNFSESSFPTDEELKICVEAQIMFSNNDSESRWVNGTMGRVIAMGFDDHENQDVITVQLPDGKIHRVLPHEWKNTKYVYNSTLKTIEEVDGDYFIQYPLKLAWAVTIHKSQGKTFDKVKIDLGWGCFSHGQLYVALSRCTSLNGIRLEKRIRDKDVIVDPIVNEFIKSCRKDKAYTGLILHEKVKSIKSAIEDNKSMLVTCINKFKRVELNMTPIKIKTTKPIGVKFFCEEKDKTVFIKFDQIEFLKAA